MPLRNYMIAHKEKKYFHPQKHIAHSTKNFAELLILMQCINKLYLYILGPGSVSSKTSRRYVCNAWCDYESSCDRANGWGEAESSWSDLLQYNQYWQEHNDEQISLWFVLIPVGEIFGQYKLEK